MCLQEVKWVTPVIFISAGFLFKNNCGVLRSRSPGRNDSRIGGLWVILSVSSDGGYDEGSFAWKRRGG